MSDQIETPLARAISALREAGWTKCHDDCWRQPDDSEADGSEALQYAERLLGAACRSCGGSGWVTAGNGYNRWASGACRCVGGGCWRNP